MPAPDDAGAETQDLTGEFLHRVWKRGQKSKREVGEMFGLTYGQCAGRIWRYEQQMQGKRKANVDLFNVDLGISPVVEGDWMIVGDLHCPTTDYDFAQLVGMLAEKHGLDNLLIAGDVVNQEVFSVYPRKGMPIPWQKEKAAARQLLEEWMDLFKRIIWTAGNHERRLSRAVWGAYDMVDLRDIIVGYKSPIEVSQYAYSIIDTATGQWRVTHPKNYSRIPLRTANRLALKHRQHVITFHEHHLGRGWADDGLSIIANGGGLFEPVKMEYVIIEDSTAPKMNKGFCTLIDGYLEIYGEEPYTNWSAVLSETDLQPAARPAVARAA